MFVLAALLLGQLAACAPNVTSAPAKALAAAPDLTPDEERAVVLRVAELVEANYVHEAKARTIAADLRASARSGAFDRHRDPRDLADALTNRLKKSDLHFKVMWAEGAPASGGTPPGAPMSEELAAKRFNQWFRKVEVLPGNIGYLQLNMFVDLEPEGASPSASPSNAARPSPAKRAADAALAFVQDTDAIIVDLRENGGGGEMVTYLLSHYLPPGTLLGAMRGRTESMETRTFGTIGGTRRLDVPIYVLVSGCTGSAAEFFAYSLQTRGRATIVGERTAGAANPYDDYDVGHGFRISISDKEPIDARSGTNWEGRGVMPDVTVASTAALVRAEVLALEGVLRGPIDEASALDARWALEALRTDVPAPAPAALAVYAGVYGWRSVRVDGGTLVLERERWPKRPLRFLGKDTFWIDGTPSSRIAFDRDARGQVVALTELESTGRPRRHMKDAPVPR